MRSITVILFLNGDFLCFMCISYHFLFYSVIKYENIVWPTKITKPHASIENKKWKYTPNKKKSKKKWQNNKKKKLNRCYHKPTKIFKNICKSLERSRVCPPKKKKETNSKIKASTSQKRIRILKTDTKKASAESKDFPFLLWLFHLDNRILFFSLSCTHTIGKEAYFI